MQCPRRPNEETKAQEGPSCLSRKAACYLGKTARCGAGMASTFDIVAALGLRLHAMPDQQAYMPCNRVQAVG